MQEADANRNYSNLDRYKDPNPVRWIQKHFFIPETNQAMQLHDSQKLPLQEALATEGDNFRYSTVVWSAIKKSAKSSIAAAVGLWVAFQRDWSTVKVIANDLKQADSRVAYYMRRAILLHPEWRHFIKITNYRIELPNHSIIEAIPIDPRGEAGGNDDLLIFSEIWGWKNTAALTMWTEATLSPLKFGKSLRWCETYSGIVGESPILEQLYEQGVTEGRCLNEQYEMYANDPARMFTLWNTKPHLDWQSDAYYAQEAAMLTPTEFQRVHQNQWVSSEDVFVPAEWWDSKCLKKDLPPLGETQQLVIAVDAGISSDCFAIVGGSKHDDRVAVRYSRVWYPPKGGKLDFSDGDDSPEAALKALIAEGRVAVIVFDPYQLHDLMGRIRREQGVWTDPFDQGSPRLLADKSLYDMIREGRVWHDGSHAHLSEHVKNANRKPEADKLRIVKRNDKTKVDGCVCLSMMASTAMRLNL